MTTEYQYNGDGVRVAQIEDGLRTATVQDIAALLPQVLTARQGWERHQIPFDPSMTLRTGLRGLGIIGKITLLGQAC